MSDSPSAILPTDRSAGRRGGAKTAKVGVFVDSIGTYGRGVIRGVLAYQRYRQWEISMLRTWIFQPAAFIDNWTGDGLIAMIPDQETAQSLHRLGKPVVAVSSLLPELQGVSVASDDDAVGRMAARHFLDRGFRNFIFYGHDDTRRPLVFNSRRKNGFADELRTAGFPVETMPVDDESATEFLRSTILPAAVFATNDEFGVRAIRLAERAGLRVPEQVAVLGVDNDDLLVDLGDVPLSSIDLPTFKIGFEAASLLDRLMNGETPEQTLISVPPVEVVTRQSTNITALSDPDLVAALAFIRQHAADPISVTDVVAAVPVSRRVLERRFQTALQRTLYDEIQRVHIDRACSLLISTDLSISEVARASGFTSRSRFHATFADIMGRTPKEHRQTYHDSRRAFEQIGR
ncbi:MAG: DNA-binding transcriptional regulator [Tepidisphaeraceae bacterium]